MLCKGWRWGAGGSGATARLWWLISLWALPSSGGGRAGWCGQWSCGDQRKGKVRTKPIFSLSPGFLTTRPKAEA